MKFRYQKQLDFRNPQLPWASRLIIRVLLSFDEHQQAVMALIDSGADVTLFHASLARALGITTFDRDGWASGISGEKIPVYYKKIRLQLDGVAEPVEVDAGFVDSPGVGALPGESGFFEHFRVCFERSKEEIEIRPTRT